MRSCCGSTVSSTRCSRPGHVTSPTTPSSLRSTMRSCSAATASPPIWPHSTAPDCPSCPARTPMPPPHLSRLGSPEQVIAHHYTRYLGDLSGGQAIRTLMRRHYGLPKTALTMWDFTEAGKTKPYKEAYRRRLDEVASTGGAEQIIIAETMEAFRLNGELLVDLTEATEGRIVTVA